MTLTNHRRVFILFFFPISICWGQGTDTALSEFETARESIVEGVLSGDLASGVIVAASEFFTHRNHPEFPELTKSLRQAYSGLGQEDARALLDFRQGFVSANPNGLAWLDVGLLAESLEEHELALAAFNSALQDPECCQIPGSYQLLGKTCLNVGDVTGALVAYGKAVNAASMDPEIGFRIRNGISDELFVAGHYDLAKEALQACQQETNIPDERFWGLVMEVIYSDWYIGDETAAALHVAEIEELLATDAIAPTLQWRKDTFDYASQVFEVAQAAVAGSTDARMLMDYFAATASFLQMDKQAVADRMEPWAQSVSLDSIAEMDPKWREMAVDAVSAYYLAIRTRENAEEIAGFFQTIIDHPVLGTNQKLIVDAYCWIGYCMSHASRLEEAVEYYDLGLTADEVNNVWSDGQTDVHPTYITNGIIRPEEREGYVANYRNVIQRLELREGK